MADLVRNDPTQTIPASNALVDTIESFNQTVRAAAEEISNSKATEGCVQQASVAAAEALRGEADRYTAATQPKLESIRTSAESQTRVAEDGGSSVNTIDTAI